MQDDTPASWTPEAAPGPTAVRERALEIRFTGSGSEYFRIWVVNLLLSIVTLSLYRPWAKVRRLRYFYANTLVDGHALDFHGDPRKMLRGYLLAGLMLLSYSAAGRFSPVAALVALLILAVLWPALLRASMQFRLANTSWRGLRFQFSGTLDGAYRAMLPLFIPAIALGILGLGVTDPAHPPSWYLPYFGLTMLATLALMPLAWWNFKRFQHDNFNLGQWRTKLATGPGSVYGLSLRLFGVWIGSTVAVMVILVILGVVVGAVVGVGGRSAWMHDRGLMGVLIMAATLLFYFLALIVPVPYAISRSQNLIWGHTRSDEAWFLSTLSFEAMLKLTIRNWLLMVVTLGLYYPFAAVASYRLRVESITPQLAGDLDQVVAQSTARASDASGDAAGDLFGIDIGL
ncbi:MAG: YjgN family protein [Burkholderiaceae bacterium]